MSQIGRQSLNTSNVLCVIMGGGQGTRLFPLTKDRAKPAVPLAGKYRLVDIPISNCINSGFRRIYILTQFNSTSLHSHISRTYKFDQFTSGFVEILAAQQTLTDTSWYEGTADAVRKNLIHFLNHDFDYLIILSGDQLYRMDFRPIVAQHVETGADITVATIPVGRREAQSLGIMQIDAEHRITRFVEKPKDAAVLDSLRLATGLVPETRHCRARAAGRIVSRLHGHLRFQPRSDPQPARQSAARFRQAHHSRTPSRRAAFSPTFFKAIGRTSAPSARFSRRTLIWFPSCRASISST